MPGSLLTKRLLVVTCLVCSGFALAGEQDIARQKTPAQRSEPIYGSQLMSTQERAEHRAMMRAATSASEREKIRSEHHEKMRLRAAQQGVALPETAPARGSGMPPCGAAPRPCGRMAASGRLAPPTASQGAALDIPHESVGIGEDDPGATMPGNYNLHLVFATQGSGQYLADIKIVIEDSSGRKLLETESPGPIFYARLPPGSYRVSADFRGTSLRKSVTVKENGLRDLYFHWRSEAVAAD